MKFVGVFFILLSLMSVHCDGYKILAVAHTSAKSHFILGSALFKELAARGHEITVISPFPQKTPIKNYRDVSSEDLIAVAQGFMTDLFQMKNLSPYENIVNILNMGSFITNVTFQIKSVKDFVNSNEKFDVVLVEIFLNDAMIGFGQHFNAPVIGYGTFAANYWHCDLIGTPSPLSYVPNAFLSYTNQMSFWQRANNVIFSTFEMLYYNLMYLPAQETLYNDFFPEPKPSFSEVRNNVSLMLINSHFTLNYPRPLVPNMIEVGGFHVNRKTKPLPPNIKQFLDSAKDGAIYFSMGSNLKSALMPKEKINAILKVFGSLKEKVLWKWENPNLPGKSDNILISDWFPQDDILAHPNIKLFITHGGLLSTTEAIYHGVPVLGIPIFGDQFLNMAQAEKAGYGRAFDFDNLNENDFREAVTEMLSNKKYSENMKKTSKRHRDQPQTPMDTAVYWIEYVARHEGAPYLRSAGQDLSFIQYHNLDVFAMILVAPCVFIYLLFVLLRKLFCSKSGKSVKSVKKVKKQ